MLRQRLAISVNLSQKSAQEATIQSLLIASIATQVENVSNARINLNSTLAACSGPNSKCVNPPWPGPCHTFSYVCRSAFFILAVISTRQASLLKLRRIDCSQSAPRVVTSIIQIVILLVINSINQQMTLLLKLVAVINSMLLLKNTSLSTASTY